MEITDIKFRHTEPSGKLRALVSVTFDGVLAVHDIKIIHGDGGMFVAMPAVAGANGKFRDIAHPLNAETRHAITRRILDEYAKLLTSDGADG